jgi:hypothetical protein
VPVRRPPLQAHTWTAHLCLPSPPPPGRLQDHRPSTAVPADLKPGALYLLSDQLTSTPRRSIAPPWKLPSGEPPPRPTPQIGFPSALARTPARPFLAARCRPAGIDRQATAFSFPCFRRGPKGVSGPNRLAGPGQVPLWAKPTATVPNFIFLSNYSNSILIKVQTSKIIGKCMDLIKL